MSVPRLRPWSHPREAVWLLLSGATFRTCAPIALCVGTLLSLVNQGDVLARGNLSPLLFAKIGLNLLIPYLTSSAGALLSFRSEGQALGSTRR